MSLKNLFGLGDVHMSDAEIMRKLKNAFDNNLHEIELLREDGTCVTIKLPHLDFSKHIDPWDGKVFGKGAS